jgi:8-oxo-dGTP pyrophosphatase MutT (NUDIX family)
MADPVLDATYDPLSDSAVRESSRAPRPRDAATLILVRRDGEPKILMGRRHSGHAFMPSKWVFPGGAVDRTDSRAPSASELDPETARRLGPRARALALAAIRETFEEAGLLLARPAGAARAPAAWRSFTERGVLPDLAPLAFVARAITPPYRHKRFDARFFMADAEHLLSLDRLADTGELEEIAWFSMEDAETLDLPSITRFVVREVGQRLDSPERRAPFVRMIRGARIVDWL